MDQSVVDELEATGYSHSYTLTMAQSSPLITFEVVGNTQQQAQATAEQLVELFGKSVATLQRAYGVSVGDQISARRLDLGTNVKTSTSKLKRALVAVAGAGLLMTAGVTVGFDAWMRSRRRRKGQAAKQALSEPSRPAWLAPSSRAAAPVTRPHANGDDRMADPELPTMTLHTGESPIIINSTSVVGATNGKDSELAEVEAPIPSDATVVLPRLPERTRWLGRNGERKKRS